MLSPIFASAPFLLGDRRELTITEVGGLARSPDVPVQTLAGRSLTRTLLRSDGDGSSSWG